MQLVWLTCSLLPPAHTRGAQSGNDCKTSVVGGYGFAALLSRAPRARARSTRTVTPTLPPGYNQIRIINEVKWHRGSPGRQVHASKPRQTRDYLRTRCETCCTTSAPHPRVVLLSCYTPLPLTFNNASIQFGQPLSPLQQHGPSTLSASRKLPPERCSLRSLYPSCGTGYVNARAERVCFAL